MLSIKKGLVYKTTYFRKKRSYSKQKPIIIYIYSISDNLSFSRLQSLLFLISPSSFIISFYLKLNLSIISYYIFHINTRDNIIICINHTFIYFNSIFKLLLIYFIIYNFSIINNNFQ